MIVPECIREFVRKRAVRPLLRLMRGGVTPRRLAWSMAVGAVVGINPSVGIPTVLLILLAWLFGLDQLASQIGSYIVAPLHFLLFVPFVQLGVYLFRTRRLPMTGRQFEQLSRHPVRMFHSVWQWEWHALVAWALVAAVATPVLARYLRRVLVLMMRRHRTLLRSKPVAE